MSRAERRFGFDMDRRGIARVMTAVAGAALVLLPALAMAQDATTAAPAAAAAAPAAGAAAAPAAGAKAGDAKAGDAKAGDAKAGAAKAPAKK